MPWKQIYVYVNYVYIIIDWGIRAPHYRQLASMSKPGSALTFTYDADGNRASKTVNGVTTIYTYVDGRVTDETNGTDTIHYRYDTNGTLLSMNLNGAEYYYLYNGQRDVIGLYDANGNVVVEYTYDAWGKPLTTTGSLACTVGAKNPLRLDSIRLRLNGSSLRMMDSTRAIEYLRTTFIFIAVTRLSFIVMILDML